MDSLVRINEPAPEFELQDDAGRRYKLGQATNVLLLLHFWSAECPWSARADEQLDTLRPAWGEAVYVWYIASNANEDAGKIAEEAELRGIEPVLFDRDQDVADSYGVPTTPYFILLDEERLVRYIGGLDDTSFRQREPSRHYLADAVEAVLAGRTPDPQETPGYGCSIVRHGL